MEALGGYGRIDVRFRDYGIAVGEDLIRLGINHIVFPLHSLLEGFRFFRRPELIQEVIIRAVDHENRVKTGIIRRGSRLHDDTAGKKLLRVRIHTDLFEPLFFLFIDIAQRRGKIRPVVDHIRFGFHGIGGSRGSDRRGGVAAGLVAAGRECQHDQRDQHDEDRFFQ